MSQSSFSLSQFDEHVDNFNDDVLDLQQRDARVAMLDFRMVVDDDIEMEVRYRNENAVALLAESETGLPMMRLH